MNCLEYMNLLPLPLDMCTPHHNLFDEFKDIHFMLHRMNILICHRVFKYSSIVFLMLVQFLSYVTDGQKITEGDKADGLTLLHTYIQTDI